MSTRRYALALGGNVTRAEGRPEAVLRAALAALGAELRLVAASPVIATAPLGPSIRRFANAAAIVESDLSPPALLARLKAIERRFGRRRGRRWGARPLDLDILLWSGGRFASAGLAIPHPRLAGRRFVARSAGDDRARLAGAARRPDRRPARRAVDPAAPAP